MKGQPVMPKLIRKGFTLEFELIASGPYDLAYFYEGKVKFAQLTLIRGESAQNLVKLIKEAGVHINAKGYTEKPDSNPAKPVKKVVKKKL